MVPHYSGWVEAKIWTSLTSDSILTISPFSFILLSTTLDAQQRYAAGTKEIIDNYLNKKPQNPANVIVENGDYASKAYGQRK